GGGGGRRGGFAGGGGQRGPTQELGPNGQPLDESYIVWWAPDDQMRIQEELTTDRVQSHWRIWTIQEDLWVYETLLQAIAATNKPTNAKRYSDACVRALSAMEVGKPAAQYSRTPNRIFRQEKSSSGGEDGESGESAGAPTTGEFSEGAPGEEGYPADEMGIG